MLKLRQHYQVNEIFPSVQGEGVLMGTLSTFVRLQGCTVGCPWCDTKYTWAKGGERMKTEEIIGRINDLASAHVVITGGEPTMYNLDGLLIPLKQQQYRVQLETSGQHSFKGKLRPDWITWSPKENLGYESPFDIYMECHEVKWVIDARIDFEVVWSTFEDMMMKRPENVPHFVLMAEGCPPTEETFAKAYDFLIQIPEWAQPFFRYGDRIQYRVGVR